MAYTTATDVQAILDQDADVSDIQPFIDVADNLVVNVCVPEGYDDNTLKQIETWLAAHFFCIRRPRTKQEDAKGVNDYFDSKVDLGLKVTRYGQMVLLLDYKGALARLDFEAMGKGKPKISATWLGKNPRRRPPTGWPAGFPF